MTQRTINSLAQAVEVYYEEIRHFIQQRTHSASIAEDVIQETWIRASTTAASMPDNPRAYLYRMASNLAIDHLRQNPDRPSAISTEPQTEPPASPELQPDVAVAAQQEYETLTSAIRELPDKCREVFILYRGRGLTMREIAVHLSISEGTVEKHIARAMVHCRSRLRAAGREI